jgi:hypothetical protein
MVADHLNTIFCHVIIFNQIVAQIKSNLHACSFHTSHY